MIPHLSFFRAGLGSILLLLYNINNYGLANDLLNNSIKSISSQLINIIPKKLYAKNKEKLPDCFEQIAEKYPNLSLSDLSDIEKMTFRAIQPNPSGSSLLGKLHVKIEKRLSDSF